MEIRCIYCCDDCGSSLPFSYPPADSYQEDVDSKKKLDDLIHLAELCIEVLQQNEEHHAEVISVDISNSNTLEIQMILMLLYLKRLLNILLTNRFLLRNIESNGAFY